MDKIVSIEVGTKGEVTVSVNGVKGKSCKALTAPLEKALGHTVKSCPTPEMNEATHVTQRSDESGFIRVVYDDHLRPLLELGKARIERASHVEPTAEGKWAADLEPVAGPTLGPFETRAEALKAEVAWIEQHVI